MKWSVLILALAIGLGGCASDCGCGDGDCEGCVLITEPQQVADVEDVEVESRSRSYRFTVEARIPAEAGTEILDVWVPLPMNDDGVQEVSNLEVSTNGNSSRGRITTEPVHGNRMYHVRIEKPDPMTTVRWSADVLRHLDVGQGRGPMNAAYLRPNRLIPLDGEAAERARKLGVDDVSRPVAARAKTIYDDVLDEMAYDKGVAGYGFGDFERSVTVCKGNCTDFHARFIGVGRAAKIPVRFTMGIPMKSAASGTYDSYHCWAHWHDGETWRPVDISEADKIVATDPFGAEMFFGKLDHDRLALTFGRDIILEPRQQGEPLNYFVFPYAEADGRPVNLGKDDWVFTYSDL